jgi:hypothetical protein
MAKSKQQKWNEEHPNVIQKAQQEYNKKRPVWSVRLTLENTECWKSRAGKTKTVARK